MEAIREKLIANNEHGHIKAKADPKNLKKRNSKQDPKHFEALNSYKKKEDIEAKRICSEQANSECSLTIAHPDTKKHNKVALLCWNSSSGESDGPDGTYISHLASALANEGQEVHVFTRKGKGLSDNEKKGGVFYHRIDIDPTFPLQEGITKFGNRINYRIKKIESHESPFDVIHCHNWQPAKALKSLQNDKSRQIVLTLSRDLIYNQFMNNNGNDKKLNMILERLIRKSNSVVCMDQGVKEKINNNFTSSRGKITIIPDAFDWENFQGVKDQGQIKKKYNVGPIDTMVLFVGQFNNNYAPDILIDAVPALLKNNPKLHFILVGDGELMWPIKVKAHYLHFEHAIRLVGHKEGKELYELFQAADIVLIPNKTTTGAYQVLAAWSAKKPVVATSAGGFGLIKHMENGITIYDNPGSVVWGIERLLFDWDKAHKIAENGWRQILENYTWKAVAKKVKQLYKGNNHHLSTKECLQ